MIADLIKQEPWRVNQGQPRNALDPAWTPESTRELCDGTIDYETIDNHPTGWWFCEKCGFCSNSSRHEHRTVQHPLSYYRESTAAYREKRRAEGLSDDVIESQLLFLGGVVARYAATLSKEEFTNYVEKHLVLR